MTASNQPGLSRDDVKLLRRPYHTNAVKWLPIGRASESGVMMLPHIDASLVIERLNEVDPQWTETTVPMLLGADVKDPFGLQHMSPWQCLLTVNGVTRSGIGQLDGMSNKPDGKHLKAGESDALKRAALKFGVGAYLRAIPPTWLERRDGTKELFTTSTYNQKVQFKGLTAAGKKSLRAQYVKVIEHAEFAEHYGEMVDYGDLADDGDEHEILPAAAPASDGEIDVLIVLSKYTGRETTEEYVRSTYEDRPFGKALAQTLQTIKQNLGVSSEDTEKLRALAQDAAMGDEKALEQMRQGLDQLSDLAATPAVDGDDQEQMPV